MQSRLKRESALISLCPVYKLGKRQFKEINLEDDICFRYAVAFNRFRFL